MLQNNSLYVYNDDDSGWREGKEGTAMMMKDLVKDDNNDLVIGNYDIKNEDGEEGYHNNEMYKYDNNDNYKEEFIEDDDDNHLSFNIW